MTIVASMKVGLLVQGHADGVHVVRPHDEAQSANRDHRLNHWQVAKDRLCGERRDDVADDAKARQDDDVHFWVTKEPQDVLVQDRVAAACWSKKVVPKLRSVRSMVIAPASTAVPEGSASCDEDRPAEQRHLVQGHARCAHVQEGCDHVDRAQDRRGTRNVNRKDREVHRHAASDVESGGYRTQPTPDPS